MKAEFTVKMEQDLKKVQEHLSEAWTKAYDMYSDYDDEELVNIRMKINALQRDINNLKIDRNINIY